jgi:hypothetical protein
VGFASDLDLKPNQIGLVGKRRHRTSLTEARWLLSRSVTSSTKGRCDLKPKSSCSSDYAVTPVWWLINR